MSNAITFTMGEMYSYMEDEEEKNARSDITVH